MEMAKDFWKKAEATHAYILSSWPKALHQEKPALEDPFALPYPFVPPCISGSFKCLFYWDTFYTNRGLINDGHLAWAKDNALNLIYLLDKYGFVPNSNSIPGIKFNSQPPYLHFMLKDILEASDYEPSFLKIAYQALQKEYAFWMKERMTAIGLNHHGPLKSCTLDDLAGYYDYVANERLPLKKDLSKEEKARIGADYDAQAEMGLDFSPRFNGGGVNCCPADLNANLYGLEKDLAAFGTRLGDPLALNYEKAAEHRKALMDRYLLDKDGLYYDYDCDKKSLCRHVAFTGQFMPFITGVSSDAKALRLLFKKLLFAHGMASCEEDPNVPYDFQANYPYSWPYDNYLAFWALRTCHLDREATELALRYVDNLSSVYASTGLLWETYDAVKGGIAEKSEYPSTEMLGWTGGSYEMMYSFLAKRKDFGNDIERKPDVLKVECDEKESPDVKVDFEATDEGFKIYLTAETSHPRLLKMRWNHSFVGPLSCFGDEFERLQGDAHFGSLNADRYFAWYYLVGREKTWALGGVKTGPNSFVSFSLDQGGVNAFFDVRCGGEGVELKGRRLLVASLVYRFYENVTSYEALRSFCGELAVNPCFPKSPVYGGNDWYCAYGKSSQDDILKDAALIKDLSQGNSNPPYMVVDDGWEEGACAGPWRPNAKFLDMAKMAQAIKKMGLRPGLWIRFLSNPSALAAHPDWAISKPGSTEQYLDPSHPGVLKHIEKDIARIKEWGFEFVKHDYSAYDMFSHYGNAFNGTVDERNDWHFYAKSKTSAEICKDFYQTIKNACGEDCLVEGCNVFSHLAVGYVEINRVGDDTSGVNWDRTRAFGVNALAFRLCQNGIFYACDADCVGFGGIPSEKNLLWADLLSHSGTPFFVSCPPEALTPTEKAYLREDFHHASYQQDVAVPLDYEWNMAPAEWLINGEKRTYDWQQGSLPRFLACSFAQPHH